MCCQTCVEDSLQELPWKLQERDWAKTSDLVNREIRFGNEDCGCGFKDRREMTTGQRSIEDSAESVYHVGWEVL